MGEPSCSNVNSESDLADLHRALNMLVKPADKNTKTSLHEVLELNLNNTLAFLKISDLSSLKTLNEVKCCVSTSSSIRWKFVCVTLHVLLCMKDILKKLQSQSAGNNRPDKAPPDLLSVSQHTTIRTCLQFIISMGLLPSLLPGVGISLAARSTSSQNFKAEDLMLLEKYERLAGVTRGLLVCSEHHALRSIIITNHLGDLMAALSQLSFVPLKKPMTNSESPEKKNPDEFVMTPELWNKLQRDRSRFKNYYLCFIWEMYQPPVIRELLILHGAAGLKRNCTRANPPSWLKKSCITLVIHCLMRPKGVSALVKAICDSAPEAEADWSKLETIVNLITTVHTTNPEKYYKNICGQLMEILQSTDTAHSQVEIIVAVKCIEILYQKEQELILSHLNEFVLKPLNSICSESDPKSSSVDTSEKKFTQCIVNIHRLFIEHYGSTSAALPTSLINNKLFVLLDLNQKIIASPCHLKGKVESIVTTLLCNLKVEKLGKIFLSYLYGTIEEIEEIKQMNPNLQFVFGPSGGIEVKQKELTEDEAEVDDSPVAACETRASCFLEILKNNDKVGELTTNLFLILLHALIDRDRSIDPDSKLEQDGNEKPFNIDDAVKNYVSVKLLTVLSESPVVHERINSDPNYLVRYILLILERDSKQLSEQARTDEVDESLEENLFIVLMILSVAVNISSSNAIDDILLKGVVNPLCMIRDSKANKELRKLASEIYNKVVTNGVIKECTIEIEKSDANESENGQTNNIADIAVEHLTKINEEEKTKSAEDSRKKYKEALFDAYDPMIPVRGHGLRELVKLILAGDNEARKNTDELFKIFKESLENDDAYIYLAAINGLATLAYLSPETVLTALAQEYEGVPTSKHFQKSSLIIKMRIGEVLARAIQNLGDLVEPCRKALLRTFLNGVKDPEKLVRASCLSSLGTLCRAVGFRIGPDLQEIMICTRDIVKSDPSPQVRRAAVLVITMILDGLGQDIIMSYGNIILEMYRTLKTAYLNESDEVVKLQVQIAFEALNKSTMEFAFPKRKLEKKICVLNPPN